LDGAGQATAQFYRVTLDNDFPYHVYGAQQDNSTVRIASRTTDFGITESDWYDVGGGESGWIAPSPKDSQIVFSVHTVASSLVRIIARVSCATSHLIRIIRWALALMF